MHHEKTITLKIYSYIATNLVGNILRQQQLLYRNLKKMESQPIDLCINNTPCYLNGKDTCDYRPNNYDYLLVVNIDSFECTSCNLYNFFQWKPWTDLSIQKEDAFSMVFIFQPKSKERISIENKIKKHSYIFRNIPFYIDEEGVFMKKNFNYKIPSEMHTFLIDKNNSIVYVGNPTNNLKIREQLLNIINH